MKVLIAIPSYNRPYAISSKLLFWIEKLEGIDWRIFVRAEQLRYYKQVVTDSSRLEPIEVNNFRETINAIGEYGRVNGYDLIMRVDDDMSFLSREHKKAEAHINFQNAYEAIVSQFENEPLLGGVSVIKPLPYLYAGGKLWSRQGKMLLGNHIIRTQFFGLPEGIELFDDVYHSLVIKDAGYKLRSYAGCYENALVLKNEGGLQSTDRNEMTKHSFVYMQKLFPDVKLSNYKGRDGIVDIDASSYFKTEKKEKTVTVKNN